MAEIKSASNDEIGNEYKRKATVASWVYMGIITIVVVWQVFHYGSPDDWLEKTKLNNLGDFLAGVFAPIAFIWVAVAVFIQSRELSLQRDEMALMREEYKRNGDILDQQAKTAQDQADTAWQQHTAIMSQNRLAKEVANANYKVVLFEKRFELYKFFKDKEMWFFPKKYSDVREMTDNVEKTKFVFGKEIYKLTEPVRDTLLHCGQAIAHLDFKHIPFEEAETRFGATDDATVLSFEDTTLRLKYLEARKSVDEVWGALATARISAAMEEALTINGSIGDSKSTAYELDI
ncbi:hypothetical protein [Agrobacterium sp. CG674]